MRLIQASAGLALAMALLGTGREARAKKPADDALNPQTMGPRLTLMPFVGPGFRANYDHRFEVEKDMSEVRTQVIGDVAIPFAETSLNIDARFFLMTFGASVGFHDEWHVLQFDPNMDGRDYAGQTPLDNKGFSDLHRDARAVKDQNADVKEDLWTWYEGRLGFVAPGYNFMGVSTAGLRVENRPDMSFDWANGTLANGGWHLRWETWALFRDRNTGFIGPALRFMVVPRNRLTANYGLARKGEGCMPGPGRDVTDPTNPPQGSGDPAGPGALCQEKRVPELQYGIMSGIRPSRVASSDLLVVRLYMTYGLQNRIFGTQTFRQPLQILVGYMVDIDL